MRKNNSFTKGITLIFLGLFFLGVQKGLFSWEQIWPFTLIVPGLVFYIAYLQDRKNFGLLMPGTVLLVFGIYFVFLNEYGWYHMEDYWPIFIFGPGLGFFIMFFASGMKKDFWIPGTILIAISMLFFVKAWEFLEYWPLLIVLVGIYMVYVGFKNKEKENEEND